jgi:TonB family protein
MRLFICAAFLTAVCAGVSNCQQELPNSKPEHVRVYSRESGVELPQLLPLKLPIPEAIKCEEKFDGKVELSLLVDTNGRARNIMFVKPLGTDIDKFALQIADTDQFTPGKFEGHPVVAAARLLLKIESCLVEAKDSSGNPSLAVRLRSNPDQELLPVAYVSDDAVLTSETFTWNDKDREAPKIKAPGSQSPPNSNATRAPVPLIQPMAEYTEEARKARITGLCLISLIVDSQGMPRNIKVHKSLDPGLDQNAMIAVSKYRFRPAIRDGEPVPVVVIMEVNFQL